MSSSKDIQHAGEYWANAAAIVVLVIVVLGFIFSHWYVFLPLFALAGGGYWAYSYYTSHAYLMKLAWHEAKPQYDVLRTRYQEATLCPPEKMASVTRRMLEQDGIDVTQPSAIWFIKTVSDMYRRDYRGAPLPAFPSVEGTRDKWHLHETLEQARQVVEYAENEAKRATLTIDLVRDVADAPWAFLSSCEGRGPIEVGMFDAVPDIRDMLTDMSANFFLPKYWDEGVGEWLRETYLRNLQEAGGKSRGNHDEGKNVVPSEFEGSAQEVVEAYLGGTPFLELFARPVSWSIPERLRAEHGVIVAGSGGGKSQLLESMILADLDDPARPGVILIDSKGEMIERLARLDCFHPDHGALRDQLIIIDHKDKPALNMFDIEEELVDTKINEVAALMRYFFGGLFGSQLTDQMDVLFLPLLHMILRIPGATLHTFAELVDDPHQYPEVLARIPAGPRSFILNHFNDRGYAQTKTGIVTRLHRIINEVTLDEMFSAPNNAVDLGHAANAGKIILVSTDADGLQDLSPVFGKYFIAQVMNAGLARGSRQREARRPIHFYIDECAPYVDDKLAQMLTTIRSYGIGVMMAFQGEWQMKTFTPVIIGNTAIKIVGTVDDDGDAKAFANSMRTDPSFIMAQRKQDGVGQFACYTRELPRAISIGLPFGKLDEREHMSDQDYRRMRALNRAALSATPGRRPQPNRETPAAPSPSGKRPRKRAVDPDDGARTEPSGNWEP